MVLQLQYVLHALRILMYVCCSIVLQFLVVIHTYLEQLQKNLRGIATQHHCSMLNTKFSINKVSINVSVL